MSFAWAKEALEAAEEAADAEAKQALVAADADLDRMVGAFANLTTNVTARLNFDTVALPPLLQTMGSFGRRVQSDLVDALGGALRDVDMSGDIRKAAEVVMGNVNFSQALDLASLRQQAAETANGILDPVGSLVSEAFHIPAVHKGRIGIWRTWMCG